MTDTTPTLTDEQREEVAERLCEAIPPGEECPCEDYTDALSPLIARMVADAERRAQDGANDEHHPEDYCHRCDGPNISWYTPGGAWDPAMRPHGESGKWNEIICPLCFVELAGGGTWALIPRKDDGESWTSADERAQIVADAERRALREARDALYAGEGPDLVTDSDIVYGEWLGNRADSLATQPAPESATVEEVAGDDALIERAARALHAATCCPCDPNGCERPDPHEYADARIVLATLADRRKP